MKLIDSKAEKVEQAPNLIGLYKHIERIGRVCTKSEDKITDDSCIEFVERMTKLNHGAVLEHGTIYLKYTCVKSDNNVLLKYRINPYSTYNSTYSELTYTVYVTTNYRVLIENKWLDDLKYMCEPTQHHEKRITIHFTLSRAIANEFVRHRQFSFMQESTRYVNYKDGIEFIKPEWYNTTDQLLKDEFAKMLKSSENNYEYLIFANQKPQQARDILPLVTKTELYMTGTIEQWEHFLSLRSPEYGAQGVHPDAAKLGDQVYHILADNGFISYRIKDNEYE